MSFSEDMWNGFGFIYNQFMEKRKGMKHLLYIFQKEYDYQSELSNGFKIMHDNNFSLVEEGTFGLSLKIFKTDIYNKHIITNDFSNALKDKIIDPLRAFLDNQIKRSSQHNYRMIDNEIKYKDHINKLEKTKIDFHSFVKLVEDSKLQCETAKNNPDLSNNQKNKFNNKLNESLAEAKKSEKIYLDFLNEANFFREEYIKETKKILDDFQQMELDCIEYVKIILGTYYDIQTQLYEKLNMDFEKKKKSVEEIYAQNDIKEFIVANSTNSLPPFKFDYIPYNSELQTKPIDFQTGNVEIVNNVKSYIFKSFLNEVPEPEPEPQDLNVMREVDNILNCAWEGKINDEDKKSFSKYIQERKFRKYFLSKLNKFRAQGYFSLDDKGFNSISDILNITLDEVVRGDKDYESAKFCIILSQTFHRISSDPDSPRIFLQDSIDKHDCWKNVEFWEGIIKYSINEEIYKQKNFNCESAEERQNRIKTTAFSQLLHFTFNMISFGIVKEKVRETINKICRLFKIPEELSVQILNHVEECSSALEKHVKNEIIDDNIGNLLNNHNDLKLESNLINNLIGQNPPKN